MHITKFLDVDNEIVLPKRTKMKWEYSKKKNPFKFQLQDLDYNFSTKSKMIYSYIYNFIDSRVGLKYDDIYSEFCKKVPYWVGDVNTREEFNELLFGYRWRRETRYYIDDEGYLIRRSMHAPVKSKPIVVPSSESTIVYKVNKEYFRWFGTNGHKKFCKVFGYGTYHKILTNEYISVSQFNEIYSKITDEMTYPLTKGDFIKHAFEQIVMDGKVVYPGDKDYIRYLYEERRRKIKEKRDLEKKREEQFLNDLNNEGI